MQVVLILLQLLIGIVQFFAIEDGLTHWLNLSPVVSMTMAAFFALLPMVGSALGMAGALSVWGWTWWQGGLVFLVGFAIGLAIMTIIALTELFNDEHREWLAGPGPEPRDRRVPSTPSTRKAPAWSSASPEGSSAYAYRSVPVAGPGGPAPTSGASGTA